MSKSKLEKVTPIQIEGNSSSVTTSKVFEVIPFSNFSDNKTPYFNPEDFYIMRSKEVSVHKIFKVGNKNEVIKSFKKESVPSNWSLISKEDFDEQLEKGIPVKDNKSEKRFITESDYQKITTDRDELEKFTRNFHEMSNSQKALESGEGLRMVEYFNHHLAITVLKLEDGSLISSGFYVDVSSSKYNLELAAEKILINDQVEVLVDYWRPYRDNFVNKKEVKNLNKIIDSVPYYNQNEEGNLSEIKVVYYPTNEQLERLLNFNYKNNKDNRDLYEWILEPSNELVKNSTNKYSNSEKIAAFGMGLIDVEVAPSLDEDDVSNKFKM